MKLTGEKRSTRRKTCPSATLSTTNPTWTDPESNPGFRGERLATNRLRHGTAMPMFVCLILDYGSNFQLTLCRYVGYLRGTINQLHR
jgi:hypothetical protein